MPGNSGFKPTMQPTALDNETKHLLSMITDQTCDSTSVIHMPYNHNEHKNLYYL